MFLPINIRMSISSLFFKDECQRNAERSFDINKAEAFTRSGKFHEAVIYIERHLRIESLSPAVERLYYPVPKKYYDCVVKYLPDYIRTLPPEDVKNFILLVFSVMHRESKFNEHARNPISGARGLMQVLPGTGAWVARDFLGMKHFDLYNYEDNIRIGTAYLSYLIESSGGMDFFTLNLSRWNYGEGHVSRLMQWRSERPLAQKIQRVKETRIFLEKVRGNYRYYRRMYGEMVMGVARKKSEYPAEQHEQPVVPKPAVIAQHPQKPKLTISSKPKHEHRIHAKPAAVHHAPAVGKFRVQVASFQNAELAKKFKDKFTKAFNMRDVHLVPTVINEEDWTRVQVWFDDMNKARRFLKVMQNGDYPNAWIP